LCVLQFYRQDKYMQIEFVTKDKGAGLTYRTKISHLKIFASFENGEYIIHFPVYDHNKLTGLDHPFSPVLSDFPIPLYGESRISKKTITMVQEEIEDEIQRQFDRHNFTQQILIIDALAGVLKTA